MKKPAQMLKAIVIMTLLVVATIPLTGALQVTAVDSESTESFEIGSYEQLNDFIKQVNSGTIPADTNAYLTADITVPDTVANDWTPLAKNKRHAYSGTFDGAGYTISGIAVNRTYPDPYAKGTHVEDYTAFISFLGPKGVVKDLNLKATITDVNNVAGLVSQNEGTIEGCTFEGSLTSNIYPHGTIEDSDGEVGGIAALNRGTVKSCKTLEGTTINHGGANVGGIVGHQVAGAAVVDCENNAAVTVRTTAYTTMGVYTGLGAGIVGFQSSEDKTNAAARPRIANCVNKGAITGEQNMGGICGFSIGGIIKDCTNSGNIEGVTRVHGGGICGNFATSLSLPGDMQNCENSGSINLETGNRGSFLGGIVGIAQDYFPNDGESNPRPVKISNCKNSGSVFGEYGIGGIAGGLSSSYYVKHKREHVHVHGLMNLGSVCGVNAVGGVVGSCPGVISDTINYGNVKGVPGKIKRNPYCSIGGIVGDCEATGGVSTSYNLGKLKFGTVKDRPVYAGGVAGSCIYNLPGCYYSTDNSGKVKSANGLKPRSAKGALSLSQMAGKDAKKSMKKLFNGTTSWCSRTVWHMCKNVKQGSTLLAMTPQFEGLSADVTEILNAGVALAIPIKEK